MRPRILGSFSLAVMVVVLAACSQGGSGSQNVTLPAKNRSAWVLPLDKYRTPLEAQEPRQAWALKMSQCLSSRGIRVEPIQVEGPTSDPVFNPAGRRLFNVEIAGKYGYHMGEELPGGQIYSPGDVVSESVRGAGPAAEKAFDECAAQYDPILSSVGDDSNPNSANWLGLDVSTNVEASGELSDEAARWRDCMKPLGIPDLPDKPKNGISESARERMGLSQEGADETVQSYPTKEEIELAIFDAKCQESSGYSEALYNAQFDGEANVLEANYDQLEAQYAKDMKAIDDARAILEKGK